MSFYKFHLHNKKGNKTICTKNICLLKLKNFPTYHNFKAIEGVLDLENDSFLGVMTAYKEWAILCNTEFKGSSQHNSHYKR